MSPMGMGVRGRVMRRRVIASVVVLLLCYMGSHGVGILPVACSSARTSGNPAPQGTQGMFTTKFSVTEDPISEGGKWTNGKTDGVDWSDVAATPGLAFGTQVPPTGPPYNDSVAILKGSWGANQTATATVHTVNQQGGDTYEEVELWLRGTVLPHSITGYEINFRCLTGSGTYAGITYWNGPLNDFGSLAATQGPGLNNGDVVSANIVGNTITVSINGVQVLQAQDPSNRFPTGSPGMGFYYQGSAGSDSDYGFASFTATDQS